MHNDKIIMYIDDEQEDQGNDCLYIVIADIIEKHNHIIENLYCMMQNNRQLSFNRLLPEEYSKILPTEVTRSTAIIGNFSK